MKALAEFLLKWQCTQQADKDKQRDAQAPTQEWVNLLKALRLQYVKAQEWRTPIKQQALSRMFVDGFTTIDLFKGLFCADRVAICVLDAAAELMAQVSQSWSENLRALAEKINSSCVRIAPEVKDNVLSDEKTCKALLGNPGYEEMPKLCEALTTFRKLIKGVGHDGTRLPHVVAIGVMKDSGEVCMTGYHTVSTTFGVFLCLHVLPQQKILLERRKEIKSFRDTCSSKGVVVSADITECMDKYKEAQQGEASN